MELLLCFPIFIQNCAFVGVRAIWLIQWESRAELSTRSYMESNAFNDWLLACSTVQEQWAKRTMNIPYISVSNPQAAEGLGEDGYFRVTCKRALMCTVTKAPATNGDTQPVNNKHVGVLGNDGERHPRQTDRTHLSRVSERDNRRKRRSVD